MREGGKESETRGANEKVSVSTPEKIEEKRDVVRSGRRESKRARKGSLSLERKVETGEKRGKHWRKERSEERARDKKEHEPLHKVLKHGETCVIA